MEKRIQIEAADSAAYKGMYQLENYLHQSQLTKTHLNLIKTRASQLNQCSFCIDMHTKEGLENGEQQQRLFLLNAWRETELFTEEERIILQMTEEVTMIHQKGLTNKTYQKAIEKFDDQYVSQIIMAIATINAWNRIGISTHMPLGN
ncbi:MAG: hypothetical protein COA50_01650 [Flavobacteriaceae bacterium]|nr:MAG: hypothetical protein COA50_01650 [Flavobacteriaceae bacterium]